MKKAFTFVELAIVLVIIGLIMGLSLKGREIISSAEMRREVNKLRKYDQAFHSNFLRKGSPMPVAWDNSSERFSDNITNHFKTIGLLNDEDIKLRYVSLKSSFVLSVRALSESAGGGYVIPWDAAVTDYTNIGVRMVDGYDNYLCNIEAMLDDRDVAFGNGRSSGLSVPGDVTNFHDDNNDVERAYADCSILEGKKREYTYVFFLM